MEVHGRPDVLHSVALLKQDVVDVGEIESGGQDVRVFELSAVPKSLHSFTSLGVLRFECQEGQLSQQSVFVREKAEALGKWTPKAITLSNGSRKEISLQLSEGSELVSVKAKDGVIIVNAREDISTIQFEAHLGSDETREGNKLVFAEAVIKNGRSEQSVILPILIE